MTNLFRITLAASVVLGLGTSTALASGPPRYRLEVGQELIYRGSSEFKFESGSFAYKNDWSVWVVRKNVDGGCRLVVQSRSTMLRDGKTQGDPDVTVAYLDLAPDGTIAPNESWGYRLDPTLLFPRLPRDLATAERGWEDVRKGHKQFTADGRSQFKLIASGKGEEDPWTFEEVRESPLNAIYLFTFKYRYTFDPRRGAISRIESNDSQGWGFVGKGSGTTELVEVKRRDPDWIKTLTTEADRYFATDKQYQDLTRRASQEPVDDRALAVAKAEEVVQRLTGRAPRDKGEARSPLLAEAGKILDQALAASTLPPIREQLEALIKQHKRMASYYHDQAVRRAGVMGKAAADWETKDIDGKPHALKDYKGKVVILDFWYRGCGWCIRAMPQINELAEEFRGQPVAILGMNTDRVEQDARFVIDKMGLKYPTLKAEGLPQKYGVQGFPTLIVIGPDGKVRDIHVGYSPTLREEVGKAVRELLPK
jgi:thiol-disulfide isomerase/thioredoxin